MNRKERRAANKRRDETASRPNALAFGTAGLSTADLAAEASRSYRLGRINQAQEICRQILVREPAHVQSLNLLGLMAQASGDHRGAVKMFAKAIASDEVNAACHYNLGNSYQALRNRTKAIAHFSKALALGMDEKAVAFILQSPVISTYVARVAGKRLLPITNVELFGTEGIAPLANDLFLRCAMEATTLASVQLELLLGYTRAELLEDPYPRWTINPLNAFAADRARGRTIAGAEQQAELDILIAGCGTGLHAIQIAQVYPRARLLAVDISLPSLAYARRKTRELGLRNIEYAQADILELDTIDRTFDSIESVGVLHHLAEPTIGWRALVSLLRPGGTMRIGLYSDLARRIIVEARARIAARGYRAAADDIRRCRQEIIREAEHWKMLVGARDFYSMSGCRDLLFNVMEHRFTIPQIAAFLNENDLSFLAFEPFDDPAVIEGFHKKFAGVADEANLDQWSRFEADHPETFWGMYVFTVSKNAY